MTTAELAPPKTKALALAEEMQILADKLDADYNAQQQLEDRPLDEWLPSWYLGQQATIDAMREQIKKQQEVILRYLMTQENALKYRWGTQFQEIVDRKLSEQTGRKKSIDFLTGTAGYRSVKETFTVTDKAALKQWCQDNDCLDALELTFQRIGPVVEYIEATGELPPGVKRIEKHEKFFPELLHPSLEEELRAALPEGDTP